MRYSFKSITMIATCSLLVAHLLTAYAAHILSPFLWLVVVALAAWSLIRIDARVNYNRHSGYDGPGWLRSLAALVWDPFSGAFSFTFQSVFGLLDGITERMTWFFGFFSFILFLTSVADPQTAFAYLELLLYLSPGFLVYVVLIIFRHEGLGFVLKHILVGFFAAFGLYALVGVFPLSSREEPLAAIFTLDRFLFYVPFWLSVFVFGLYHDFPEPEPVRQVRSPQRPTYTIKIPPRKRK